MLPSMVQAERLVKQQVTTFRGYNHNPVLAEGELYEMKNLTGDEYPVLTQRRGRTLVRTIGKPNGLFSAKEKLCWVDGTDFYYDGTVRGTVTDSVKRFARLGPYVLIFPDKAYYHTGTGEWGMLEASWTGSAVITHYSYDASSAEAQEVYKGNAITTTGAAFPFQEGDAVTVSGSSEAANNRTSVIREIRDSGRMLVFSNETFLEQEAQTLTLRRTVPDMDYFCENENRLWGCHGDTIYASALGNPFRWNNLEGLATDSYAVTVGTDGAFTGAASYLGYAMFFKADAIHKMYGSKPANFQAMCSAVSGVLEGAGDSLAMAGEMLFYLSRTGIVSYSGGVPVGISAQLGPDPILEAVGGSDGRKYYVSVKCAEPRSSRTANHADEKAGLAEPARQDGVFRGVVSSAAFAEGARGVTEESAEPRSSAVVKPADEKAGLADRQAGVFREGLNSGASAEGARGVTEDPVPVECGREHLISQLTLTASPGGEASGQPSGQASGEDVTQKSVGADGSENEGWTMFVYDTRTGIWHKEDTVRARWFARAAGALYFVDAADGGLYRVEDGTREGIEWMAETGDLTEGSPDRKGVGKLQLRVEADEGSEICVEMMFDSDGVWRAVKRLASCRKRSYLLPVIPRRCDHYRIRLSGRGGCRVFALVREFYAGSDL